MRDPKAAHRSLTETQERRRKCRADQSLIVVAEAVATIAAAVLSVSPAAPAPLAVAATSAHAAMPEIIELGLLLGIQRRLEGFELGLHRLHPVEARLKALLHEGHA